MTDIFFLAFVFLCAGVIAVPIASRLGLGSVLGYLIAGIVISPLLTAFGVDVVSIQHFAEFGVVMMLFLVGLELEPRMLWSMRNKLLGLGGLRRHGHRHGPRPTVDRIASHRFCFRLIIHCHRFADLE